ncbi:MAG: hypothetical protein AB4290_12845 [Spirulina sp.]
MSIESEIKGWNGKSADEITEIFQTYSDTPVFIDTLIELFKIPSCQKGATWLLKAWLDKGNNLKSEQIAKLFSSLDILEHWEAKLHLLQSLPFLPIAHSQKQQVEGFLRTTLPDRNKFVRAWSYNGFYELARQYPEYQEETEQFLEMAMRDEAASVKARIRKLVKKGF